MALTNVAAQGAKPKDKAYRLKDERGLYLEVAPSGGKWWRLRYWLNGKENRLSLGVYPDVSLAQAREKRDEARKLLAQDIDPSLARKQDKEAQTADQDTFKTLARDVNQKFLHGR